MRKQREEPYTEVRRRVIEQLSCNECGMTVDLEKNVRRPDGWVTVYTEESGRHIAWDFDDWECFLTWVEKHEESPPSELEELIVRSIDEINQLRAEKEADKILSGVE